MHQIIEALPETRSDLAIFTRLAERLGLKAFNLKTDEDYLKEMTAKTSRLPAYETFKQQRLHRLECEHPRVAFRRQIEDPQKHPFPTPSGKIEIFSRKSGSVIFPAIVR